MEIVKKDNENLVLAISDYTEYLKKMALYSPKEDCVHALEKSKIHDLTYYNLDLTDEKVKKSLISLAEFIVEHCLFKNKLEYSPFKRLNYTDYCDFFPEMIKRIKIKDEILFDFIYGYREKVFNDFFSIYRSNPELKEKISKRLPFFKNENFNKLLSIKNKSSFYDVYYEYVEKNNKFNLENINSAERINILNNMFSIPYISGSWKERYKLSNFIDDITRLNNKRKEDTVKHLFYSENSSQDFICELINSKSNNENMLKELNETINILNVELFKQYIIRECSNPTTENKLMKGNLISRIIIKNKNNDLLQFLLDQDYFLLTSNIFFKNGESLKNIIFSKPSKKELSSFKVGEDIKNTLNSKFMLIYFNELYLKYNGNEKDMVERNEKEMLYFSKKIFKSNNYRLILNDMALLNDVLKSKMIKKIIKLDVDIKTNIKKKRI